MDKVWNVLNILLLLRVFSSIQMQFEDHASFERDILAVLYIITPKLCQRECAHYQSCNGITYNRERLMCSLVMTNQLDQYDWSPVSDVEIDPIISNVQSKAFICDSLEICIQVKTKAVCMAEDKPRDCKDVQKYGIETSGQSVIYPFYPSIHRVVVLCDMDTNSGGYTVIQRRLDGSVNFTKGWHDYTHGFGFLDSEFWIGNNIIHKLTSIGSTSLLVQLHGYSGDYRYAHYQRFKVKSESKKFQLILSGYSGTAGNSLANCYNVRFSTYDADHDTSHSSCADVRGKGGWWFNTCCSSNLNGVYCRKLGK